MGERHVMRDERRDGRDEIEEGGGKWREEQRRSRRRRERERERETACCLTLHPLCWNRLINSPRRIKGRPLLI